MENILFKKSFDRGLYTYVHTSEPFRTSFFAVHHQMNYSVDTTLLLDNLQSQFDYLISMATFCSRDLKIFTLLKYSPRISRYCIFREVKWRYIVLTDDYNGLGIDLGFNKLTPDGLELCKLYTGSNGLFHLPDLLELRDVAADDLGDFFSQATVFGLQNGRENQLMTMLVKNEPPDLTNFLQKGELFCNIMIGREKGLYNSMLLKSVCSIDHLFYEFQMILDPNN